MPLRLAPLTAIAVPLLLAGCATVPASDQGGEVIQRTPSGGSVRVQRPEPQPPGQAVTVPPRGATAPAPPIAAQGGFRTAPMMTLPGLEGVIGADSRALRSQFGEPRLDVREGDVRKLQFTGEPCVLDVYLYPPAPGAEPTATFVDARRASDGLDVDRAACVAALRAR